MNTASHIREKAYADTFASLPVPTSTRRGDNRRHVAKNAVLDANLAIKKAVATGEGLPPGSDLDVTFAGDVSVFSSAGGVMLHRLGGLRVTRSAAESGAFVTVVFRGEHVAMTVDEAFDRGLQENANWDIQCSMDEAIGAITGSAMGAARETLGWLR